MTEIKRVSNPFLAKIINKMIDLVNNFDNNTNFDDLVNAFDDLDLKEIKSYLPLSIVIMAFSINADNRLRFLVDKKEFKEILGMFCNVDSSNSINAENLEFIE